MARSIHPSIDGSIFQATETVLHIEKARTNDITAAPKNDDDDCSDTSKVPTHPSTHKRNGFKNGHGKRHAII
jgi:hypothetical protein